MPHALPIIQSETHVLASPVRALRGGPTVPAGSLVKYVERIPVVDRAGEARVLHRFFSSTDGGATWWHRQTVDKLSLQPCTVQ